MPQPPPVSDISCAGVGVKVAVGSGVTEGVPGPGVGLVVKVGDGVKVEVAVPSGRVGV